MKTMFSDIGAPTPVETEASVADSPDAQAWLPFSIAEAALSGVTSDGADLSGAWSHLLDRLKEAEQLVVSAPVNRNRIDYASGMRHLHGPARSRYRRGAPGRSGSDSRGRAHQHERRPDLGHGVSRLHLPARHDAPRRDATGCSATVALHDMSACRPWTASRRQPIAWSTNSRLMPTEISRRSCPPTNTTGNWLRIAGDHPDADGAALLLRLGHRGSVVAADRTDRGGCRSRGPLR